MRSLPDLASYHAALAAPGLAVVNFSASWCGPCHVFRPRFEGLEREFAQSARFYTVDVDQNPEAARLNELTGLPAFHLYLGGKLVARCRGASCEQTLRADINKHAQGARHEPARNQLRVTRDDWTQGDRREQRLHLPPLGGAKQRQVGAGAADALLENARALARDDTAAGRPRNPLTQLNGAKGRAAKSKPAQPGDSRSFAQQIEAATALARRRRVARLGAEALVPVVPSANDADRQAGEGKPRPRKRVCEGGVCRYVYADETVDNPPPAGDPHGVAKPGRRVVCEGGVCRFV